MTNQEMFLDMPFPLWVALAAAGVFFVLTTLSYFRLGDQVSPKKKILLGALRLLAFAAPFFFFFNPHTRKASWQESSRHIVFLQDVSQSMDIMDCDGLSRKEALRILLQKHESQLLSLQDRFSYHLFQFSGQLNPPPGARGTTALGDVLEEVTRKFSRDQLAAIIILSDGQNNTGKAPLEEARAYGQFGVPIYTLGFGKSEKGKKFFDIQAQNVMAQKDAYLNHEIPIIGEFTFRGMKGKNARIELEVEGKKISSKVVRAKSSLVTTRVPFIHKFKSQGMYKVTLRARPLPGEASASNNKISTFIQVRSKDLNVLYLDQSPRWELKFIRRALKEDKNLTFQLLFASGRRFRPPAKFKWSQYRTVILGDISPDYFTAHQLKKLKEAIYNKRVGLILLGGPNSFSRGTYASTNLSEALPFFTSRSRYKADTFQVKAKRVHQGHFVTRLYRDSSQSYRQWEALPPLRGRVDPGKLKASAITLLTTKNGDPLVVLQPNAGLGRSATVLAENTWQWAMKAEKGKEIHQKFWSQLLLWVSQQDKGGKNNLWVEQDRYRYLRGDRVEIKVIAKDGKGKNIREANLKGVLLRPDGTEKKNLSFSFEDGAHRAYVFPRQVGEYKLKVSGKYRGKSLGQAEGAFISYVKLLETSKVAANLNLLRQMGRLSGGKLIPHDEFSTLLKSLYSKPSQIRVKVKEKEKPFFDSRLLFLFFIFLLSIEWYFRRQWGLN